MRPARIIFCDRYVYSPRYRCAQTRTRWEFTYPNGTVVQMMADYNKTGNKVEFTNAIFYGKDALGNELKNELGPALMRATFKELYSFAKSGGASEMRLQYKRAPIVHLQAHYIYSMQLFQLNK